MPSSVRSTARYHTSAADGETRKNMYQKGRGKGSMGYGSAALDELFDAFAIKTAAEVRVLSGP